MELKLSDYDFLPFMVPGVDQTWLYSHAIIKGEKIDVFNNGNLSRDLHILTI